MNIQTKLNNIVKKLLDFEDFPNKQELLDECEKLKKLLSCPELLSDSVITLKANPFYRQFKLDADPQFLKFLVNRMHDIPTVEKLLDLEINYSKSEKHTLEQRLKALILLSILEDDLKEAAEYAESQNSDGEEFEIYFEDLKELNSIFSYEKITPKNIEWFLHSDLFDLISDASDCFDVSLTETYQTLLENAEIKTKKEFIEHKNVLIERANKAMKDQEPFDLKEFLSVLDAEKNHLKATLRSASIHSNKNTFYKPTTPKMATLSPVARQVIINKLKKYNELENRNGFKC